MQTEKKVLIIINNINKINKHTFQVFIPRPCLF